MQVRAKFICEEIDSNAVKFRAVTRDGENVDWSKWTPWGTIQMGISNPEALAAFEVGREYTVDFNQVEEPINV